METKFNFKSAICTSRVQSERLLSLGLRKETADMFWTNPFGDWDSIGDCMQLPISAFPEVTFENSPVEVELKLVNNVGKETD